MEVLSQIHIPIKNISVLFIIIIYAPALLEFKVKALFIRLNQYTDGHFTLPSYQTIVCGGFPVRFNIGFYPKQFE